MSIPKSIRVSACPIRWALPLSPNGQGPCVGAQHPYFRLQQVFFRQEIDLGGESEAGRFRRQPARHGADGRQYRHHRRQIPGDGNLRYQRFCARCIVRFLNWALIDAGAYDYAADCLGLQLRHEHRMDAKLVDAALRSLRHVARAERPRSLQTDFTQFEIVGEAEARLNLIGREGKIKLLGLRQPRAHGQLRRRRPISPKPRTRSPIRRSSANYRSRPGFALNVEQPLTDDLGAFLRAELRQWRRRRPTNSPISDQSVAAGFR